MCREGVVVDVLRILFLLIVFLVYDIYVLGPRSSTFILAFRADSYRLSWLPSLGGFGRFQNRMAASNNVSEALTESASSADSPKPQITSLEELEAYKKAETRTLVTIARDKFATFAEADFFRFVIKSSEKRPKTESTNDDARTFTTHALPELPEELRRLIESESLEYKNIEHVIGYKDLSLEEALKLVAVDAQGIMVGFETVGHIAHLNIPNYRQGVKKLIGKIILDKHKHIKTVVNKVHELSNEFRTMELELLAGEPNYVAQLLENKLHFEIDFANVYWNSRLIQERLRIHGVVSPGDIVVDLFAGVGAFVMYLASKECLCFANDLNPNAVKCMETNSKLNKLPNWIHTFNMDARKFVTDVIIPSGIMSTTLEEFKGTKLNPSATVHFIMNLPKSAIEYLDVLNGIAKGNDPKHIRKCKVHCYCFANVENHATTIAEQIKNVLPQNVPQYNITHVRNVAPRKGMYCVEFTCQNDLLIGT